jgi:hypothetical protein
MFDWSTTLVVHRHQSGFEVMMPDVDSWGDAAAAIAAAPQHTLLMDFELSYRQRGLWALTSSAEALSLEFSLGPIHSKWAPRDLAAVRAVAAEYLAQRDIVTSQQAARLAGGDYQHRETLWPGHIYNAITLAIAAMLLWSLAWIPRRWRALHARRAARAIARGVCPSCGYDISAVESDYCPECGRRIRTGEPA